VTQVSDANVLRTIPLVAPSLFERSGDCVISHPADNCKNVTVIFDFDRSKDHPAQLAPWGNIFSRNRSKSLTDLGFEIGDIAIGRHNHRAIRVNLRFHSIHLDSMA